MDDMATISSACFVIFCVLTLLSTSCTKMQKQRPDFTNQQKIRTAKNPILCIPQHLLPFWRAPSWLFVCFVNSIFELPRGQAPRRSFWV